MNLLLSMPSNRKLPITRISRHSFKENFDVKTLSIFLCVVSWNINRADNTIFQTDLWNLYAFSNQMPTLTSGLTENKSQPSNRWTDNKKKQHSNETITKSKTARFCIDINMAWLTDNGFEICFYLCFYDVSQSDRYGIGWIGVFIQIKVFWHQTNAKVTRKLNDRLRIELSWCLYFWQRTPFEIEAWKTIQCDWKCCRWLFYWIFFLRACALCCFSDETLLFIEMMETG